MLAALILDDSHPSGMAEPSALILTLNSQEYYTLQRAFWLQNLRIGYAIKQMTIHCTGIDKRMIEDGAIRSQQIKTTSPISTSWERTLQLQQSLLTKIRLVVSFGEMVMFSLSELYLLVSVLNKSTLKSAPAFDRLTRKVGNFLISVPLTRYDSIALRVLGP